MYSCYDEQLNQYMESGRNSKTLKGCIEAVFNYWINGCDLDEADKDSASQNKRETLESVGFRFDEHKVDNKIIGEK